MNGYKASKMLELIMHIKKEEAFGNKRYSTSKIFTHSCLILIPKTPNHQRFTDLRPISLAILALRSYPKSNTKASKVIHKVVSPNQTELRG
ncbi:hypothetical protein H5410_053775 [Solanum commersonii]|uniref:Uncharacterized protein n=1 Tax=Solanum commersonii TaxID=4109 RepID=A0A9J5X7B0_SOLCO|nr:hypothetical protein H5410_053775 [Solanum commersonii]